MPKLEVNPYEFDSRMTEWYLKTNKITQEQLTSYLKSLPDDESNAGTISLSDEDAASETR